MDIYLFLVVMHLIGTVLGVGGATMIEVHLKQALKDKKMSGDERAILGTDYTVVRVGLVFAILSGFGFLLVYKFTGQTARLYDPMMWAKLVMIVIIATNAVLLQARKMSLYWGAALSFVSWWSVALISVFKSNGAYLSFFGTSFVSTFFSVLIVYTILIVIGAITLDFIRKKVIGTI